MATALEKPRSGNEPIVATGGRVIGFPGLIADAGEGDVFTQVASYRSLPRRVRYSRRAAYPR